MKILATLLISLPLACAPLAASADKGGGSKGPSERAWESANHNASFRRGDDRHGLEHHDAWKNRESDRDRDRDAGDRGSLDPNRDRDQLRKRDADRDRDSSNAGSRDSSAGNRGHGASE